MVVILSRYHWVKRTTVTIKTMKRKNTKRINVDIFCRHNLAPLVCSIRCHAIFNVHIVYSYIKQPAMYTCIWMMMSLIVWVHDDVIKWKHFPRNWPFVRGIHRSPMNSPHKGQWRGALMFSLICVWINGWVNNREAGDLRRYRGHYDVIVMKA